MEGKKILSSNNLSTIPFHYSTTPPSELINASDYAAIKRFPTLPDFIFYSKGRSFFWELISLIRSRNSFLLSIVIVINFEKGNWKECRIKIVYARIQIGGSRGGWISCSGSRCTPPSISISVRVTFL